MIFLAHHRVPPSQLRFSFCLLARSIAPRDDNLESRGKHHRGDDRGNSTSSSNSGSSSRSDISGSSGSGDDCIVGIIVGLKRSPRTCKDTSYKIRRRRGGR